MRYTADEHEKRDVMKWIDHAVVIAHDATCLRSKCGSVIVKDEESIGEGFNSPAGEDENQRRCTVPKEGYHKKVTDKTCCVHAEQRAIMDALRRNPAKLVGSRLYFIRLSEDGNASKAGKPYCTLCSKMALDAGIKEFVLWHQEGIVIYGTQEYNALSYEYAE
ncbi:MAG: hypothetical protein PHT88_01635 [Candidatus Moranbacteria bacterium]|nr:hypothetical protein [Candidatus Moranbacteria bacterium]